MYSFSKHLLGTWLLASAVQREVERTNLVEAGRVPVWGWEPVEEMGREGCAA